MLQDGASTLGLTCCCATLTLDSKLYLCPGAGQGCMLCAQVQSESQQQPGVLGVSC